MLLGAFILIIAIETITIHYLAMKWSPAFAYALLGLSVYSGFQIFGLLKSLLFRPILLTPEKLYLKYGILAETTIAVENIERIDHFIKDIDKEKTPEVIKLSPLGSIEGHNILIYLKKQQELNSLYGSKKQFRSIALYVDKTSDFKQEIETLIHT